MTKPLAQAVADFHEAVERSGLGMPDDVAAILEAAGRAITANDPQTGLNKSFANLRRFRPGCFAHLHSWLEQADVRAAASASGAHWAWTVWRSASLEIHSSRKASDAFGMNRNGRPRSRSFTRADDAAMYAAYQFKNGAAENEDELIATAATLYAARPDEVRKAFARANALSVDDLRAAVESCAEKYR
ncbi:MAG: hypothetical protein M0Z73_05260 [Betaproteobacteria bacterium]|nr:hypothetical protein [Betaproteobacteria bacterium]